MSHETMTAERSLMIIPGHNDPATIGPFIPPPLQRRRRRGQTRRRAISPSRHGGCGEIYRLQDVGRCPGLPLVVNAHRQTCPAGHVATPPLPPPPSPFPRTNLRGGIGQLAKRRCNRSASGNVSADSARTCGPRSSLPFDVKGEHWSGNGQMEAGGS